MGPQLEYLETVLTCKGNFYAPDFNSHLDDLKCRLQELVFPDDEKKLVVEKVEPWNSVRVTLKMPADAAHKLRKLAEQKDRMLHEIGVLEVQIEGDRVISLALDNSKSESSESGRKSEGVMNNPRCSGHCVPSKDTLKTFASLPQSANVDWPLFSKIVNSLNNRSLFTVSQSFSQSHLHASHPQVGSICSHPTANTSSSVRKSNNVPENFTQYASLSPFELNPQTNRVWLSGDDKLINCQTTASSSPLLVNLLKNSGSQALLNSCSSRFLTSSDLSNQVEVPAQKRKKNQTRKSKRLKEGTEGIQLSSQNSHQGIPSSFATFQQDIIRISPMNVSSQMSTSESRKIINPYTGDLEIIDECDEPSISNVSDTNGRSKEFSSAQYINTINNSLEFRNMDIGDCSGSERLASSHSSDVSSFHNGVLKHSSRDASSEISRSNIETSTSTSFNPNIPVFNLQNNIGPNQQITNINLLHSLPSSIPSSLPGNNILFNHALSSCYMQSVLKALSSENASKLLACQSLILPSTLENIHEESKSIIDANSLAKMIQSSLLPKSLNAVRNVCPLPMDTKPVAYNHGPKPSSSNGQLPKGLACDSRVTSFHASVPQDDKLLFNSLKEEIISQQSPRKMVCSQNVQKLMKSNNAITTSKANDLMKEMFSCFSLPAYSSTPTSTSASCTPFNGHVDFSHEDQTVRKTSQCETFKNLYSTDCQIMNGYSSSSSQISVINDPQNDLLGSSSSSSATISSDSDSALLNLSSKSLSCRKPIRNIDDVLHIKSKANLTVAQLLERVDIAKNHLAFSGNLNERNIISDIYMNSTVESSSTSKLDQKSETASQLQRSSSNHGYVHPQKSLPYSNSFNTLESMTVPITSPGYPHNLTESVQKAMRGVGLDNSPSASPPPTKQLMSHLETSGLLDIDEKKPSPIPSYAKEDPIYMTDLDIIERQLELKHLEEALKSTMKNQDFGESCTESHKHLLDLDGTDLDFVFNAEDVGHLESIIALRDYDDIEKLAETLASNIDGGDIDDLINEKDFESLGSCGYKALKDNLSNLITTSGACMSENEFASSILSSSNQQSREMATKYHHSDLKVASNSFFSSEDLKSKQQSNQNSNNQNVAQVSVERYESKNSSIQKKVDNATGNNTGKIPDLTEETALHSTSNRMATRSSNKQKCPPTSNSSSHHLNFDVLTTVSAKDASKNSPEVTLQPSLRRSNRTIRKTELAAESCHTKTVERQKRTPRDEHIDNKFNPSSSNKSEHGVRNFRQRPTQKRKYSSRIDNVNENIQTTTNDQKDQTPLKKIGNSSSGSLETAAVDADYILCSKRPKTS